MFGINPEPLYDTGFPNSGECYRGDLWAVYAKGHHNEHAFAAAVYDQLSYDDAAGELFIPPEKVTTGYFRFIPDSTCGGYYRWDRKRAGSFPVTVIEAEDFGNDKLFPRDVDGFTLFNAAYVVDARYNMYERWWDA